MRKGIFRAADVKGGVDELYTVRERAWGGMRRRGAKGRQGETEGWGRTGSRGERNGVYDAETRGGVVYGGAACGEEG